MDFICYYRRIFQLFGDNETLGVVPVFEGTLDDFSFACNRFLADAEDNWCGLADQ